MHSYHEQLQTHALLDLTNRAKSGILTYPGVWLILSFTYQLDTLHPVFFYVNTGCVAAFCLLRLAHYVAVTRQLPFSVNVLNQWLVITILLAALQWGGMAAWIIYDDRLSALESVILIIMPCFALGGACTLSISSEIRTLYPMFMCLPYIAMLIHDGSSESLMLALLSCICLTYIFTASKAANTDYWAAITNHMVAEERAELMEQLSTTDPLTQLKNRMFFDKQFNNEWKRCSRMSCPLSVIMIDLDHFKRLNDNHGHVFGDECLQKAAQAIRHEVSRPSDCVARYGGEEFIALLPNTDEEGCRNLAERMRESVAALDLQAEGVPVTLTCSIGGATITPDFRKDHSNLIKAADEALYHAKNNGRNCYYALPQEV